MIIRGLLSTEKENVIVRAGIENTEEMRVSW